MALLFIDGFDHYDPQAVDSFGDPWLARGKAAYLSPQATRINGRRPSSYAMRLPEGSGGGYVKNLDATKSSLIVGAAIRVSPYQNTNTEPLLLGVRDANSQVAHLVKIGEDGRLKLYRWIGYGSSGYDQLISSSVASAPERVWNYIELQVTQGTSNGILSVRINGILAIQMTAQDTIQGGGQLLTAFVGAVPDQNCPLTLDVDDFYIADTSGTINNTFLGDVRVDTLQAKADGSLNQWTVDGAAQSWQAVSDGDDATAIRASTAGLRQSFDVEPLPVMATPAIHGVQLTMLARKTDAGLGKLKGLVVSGAQSAVSTDIILQEQLAWQSTMFERNPNGNVQWTEAAFNAAEFGVEAEVSIQPTPETAVSPLPPNLAASLLAESLAGPWPPIDAPSFLVEVLRRDTASSAIVATGMDAFGDQPWPDAQRGVFAFRHDWIEPLLERLEWQTSVTRLASGNESRQARRRIPRRLLTYKVGNARQTDALVADWLADHLGQMALWPLPQYAVHMTQSCERGALALNVTEADGRQFVPLSANVHLTYDGVQGWQETENNGRWVLIIAADGWQIAQLERVESDLLWLTEPLARAAAVGSTIMPLVWGKAIDPADLTQWVPGMVGGNIPTQIQPAPLPDQDVLDDPWLDDIPVWPDGNWRDDPTAAAQTTITRQDFSPADPWVRRDDPWATTTLQRRYLASSLDEIELWRARLWRTQGRLEAFWLPDGLAPILWVTVEADPEDGFLRVDGKDISARISDFWHRPAACLIVQPDGYRKYALTATCHLDQGGVLVLRSGLDDWVPAGSRVIRLVRCRLDHDAIDLYWHSPTLLEIPLTARQLPEPRGNDRQTYS